MAIQKMLPVGIENFEEIITQGFYYVDKTGLIKELLNNWSKVNLFTRPRRFGKSLNMSMLRAFFEMGADPQLFDGLAISKEKALCQEYMGQYPVISISLKGVEGTCFSQAKEMLVYMIKAEIKRHKYLLTSANLDADEKAELQELLKRMSDSDLKNSLWFLAQLLFRHHHKPVIVLIDEYDVPLAKAYEYGYYAEMVQLIRGVFERTLKTNEFMKMAILIGCLRIAKESIFTGLNNPKILSITNVKFDEYFGFTDREVRQLLKDYDLENNFDLIKKWYDGYRFGNVSVYCPWDVINYVDDLRSDPNLVAQNYWSNTSGNDIIRRFLNLADETTKWEIEQLIAGETIEKEVSQELTYADLDKSIQNLWSLLFATGYLTYVAPSHAQKELASGLHKQSLRLKIPNEEIRSIFKHQIYEWFEDWVQTHDRRYRIFTEAFLDGHADKIEQLFTQYLMETISIRDTSVKRSMKENFYHGMLLGILKYRSDWIVKSNQDSGDGYNDIMVVCNVRRMGLVIEVKYAEQGELASECAKAMDQIDRLHYTAALKEHEPTTILKYAIACYKKRCKVVMEKEVLE